MQANQIGEPVSQRLDDAVTFPIGVVPANHVHDIKHPAVETKSLERISLQSSNRLVVTSPKTYSYRTMIKQLYNTDVGVGMSNWVGFTGSIAICVTI